MMARLKKYLYLPLFFVSLLGDAVWFQWMYCADADPEWAHISLALSVGWCLLLTAVAAMIPKRPKRIYMGVVGGFTFALTLVHGIFFNMFRRFFSFSDMAYAGDGLAFMDLSYLVIRKLAILLALVGLALVILACHFAPRETESRKPRLIVGLTGSAVGLVVILAVCLTNFQGSDTMIWYMGNQPSTVYENFTDTKASMRLLGLYHYTFRDLQLALFPSGGELSKEETAEVEAFAAGRSHEDNEMSGVLAGKNLILVQLEAIDTWMVDYMPNLKAVKEESVVFANHYTPAYITAGTFNTEFMVNTGLFPAATGTSTSIYTRNYFPYTLAHMFQEQGYETNSYHGSEGNVYNRTAIHENWGYAYHSGSDMGMWNYQLDSQLGVAFWEMTEADPFFTFIITYSGHGAYSESNPIFQAHEEEARAQAARDDGNYVYAVGHAMETDLFVGELMDYLEKKELLEDTVLIFYADHYNYYMQDDALSMDIKGVDSLNLLQHTDWFLYSPDLAPRTVDKYTSSIDVLPTIANLFGLELDYSLMAGDDAFSNDGGYVIFNDNTWVGTDEDVSAEILQRRKINALLLQGNYWRE